jgi:hypothetical protein
MDRVVTRRQLIGDVGDMIVRNGNPNNPDFGELRSPSRISHRSNYARIMGADSLTGNSE